MPTQPLNVGISALLCALSFQLSAQYALTVESAPAVGSGGTVYRFYVNAEDPSAISFVPTDSSRTRWRRPRAGCGP